MDNTGKKDIRSEIYKPKNMQILNIRQYKYKKQKHLECN